MNVRIPLAVWLLSVAGALAVQADFSKYQVILDRKPFGEPPAVEGAGGPPVPPPVAFIKDIRLCAITESEEFGMRVGFIDIAAKKNYYLPVGSSEDGIEVVDADYDKEAALLKKGAEQFWVTLSGTTSLGSGDPPAMGAGGPGASSVTLKTTDGAKVRVSYAERLKQRREGVRKRTVEPPKLTGEELEKHLKEYQMELIRSGGEDGPPLPMELTKDMDDQLVAEGVLPPNDGAAPEGPAAEPAQ